ncbi:actin-histidine N-methyltransferase isoform X2 [Mangifera indica]|uniref:actin-histidine N-methyltransferase isoform X2 n=1 Tax=Mangifera indica TaxID=29780 RepID=UPI001CFA28C3|nr:actin-histidine N-methyltransferase isoform X2 [Mangifera indica]
MAASTEAKLEQFLLWLQANKVELRGCKIKYSDENKGFGIFSSDEASDGVLLVVPLDLAITPMIVLQDPLLGPECRAMFEEGEVDDRFLMILFLMLERLRKNSSWKPYLDMLPTTFGNPLWFTDDELLELKGTTLYRATQLQKQKLQSLYNDKVKDLVEKLLILDGGSKSEVSFEDFLWANSIFWSRALNIPLPHSYVFPPIQEDQDNCSSVNESSEACTYHISSGELLNGKNEKTSSATSNLSETIWVEGLVPGIDFCNHDLKALATWEVDGTGLMTGVPLSMYLLSAVEKPIPEEKEISISYGGKGNEELLYLYGFVIDNNPDDYLMVHYPVEAIQSMPFSDSKAMLLEIQKAEMRCLLPKSLLDHGFFPPVSQKDENNRERKVDQICNFSWSGQRKTPSYLNKLVFPENFMSALRTIAMKEDEYSKVSLLLEELVGCGREEQPSDTEVRAAVWEACGDSGALQLLVDLLYVKLMDLEENSGTKECDCELLEKLLITKSPGLHTDYENNSSKETCDLTQYKMSRNKCSSIVYRRGQKELTRLFLKEAEHALQLAVSEGN